MKKKKLLAGLTVGVMMLGIVGAASASVDTVINFSGTTQLYYAPPYYDFWAPVSVTLEPGTYSFTPVQTPFPGAIYDSAYSFGNGYWSSGYGIAINDKDHFTYYGGGITTSVEEAFAKAVSGSFTITNTSNIYFGVADSFYGDNGGGISLHLTGGTIPAPAPLPGAVWLIGSGLVGLVGLRKRRKS